MEDLENSLKDNYPDSFIPGLSQLQANMVRFRVPKLRSLYLI